MKILFSPSEAKFAGGDASTIKAENYIFSQLFDKRLEILSLYNDYILQASDVELMKLFGSTKESVVNYYKQDIFAKEGKKVVERYDGVAYDYLDYASLDNNAREYIDHNVIIFSNLFGPLYAGDSGLPDYKLKQGEKIGDLAPEKFYNQHFTPLLNELLRDEPYLDLRAGFYNKFYKPNSPYTTLKFIKNGKVISHWAKAYRGIVLRNIAINGANTIDEFMELEIENLSIKEIVNKNIHTEIIYEIV